MKGKQTDNPSGKKKVIHFQVRMWWVIGWLIALTVLLIYYWSDLQKAFSSKPPSFSAYTIMEEVLNEVKQEEAAKKKAAATPAQKKKP